MTRKTRAIEARGTRPDGRHVRRDRTERKILAGVSRLIARRGPEALGVNAVAKAAGVDKVLIYRYFGGLDGLLRRYGESADFWPGLDEVLGPEVEVVACDAYDKNSVQAVTDGADVVYQCAQPAYTEWPEKFPPLQTAMLEGTAANGAKLIVGDNLYMYGPTGGQPLHEDLPYQATGKKGVTRARMAEQLLEAHQAGKVRVAIARGSDFFGEGVRNSLLGDIVFGNLVRGKAAQVMGNIDLPHTVTCIGDFGKALVMLGGRDEALGQVWHVPNPEPRLTLRAAIERIAAIAAVPAKISVMPRAMFEIISLFHPMLREFRELRHQVNEPYVVDHAKFVAAFGDISTPLDDSCRRTVGWYRGELSGCSTRGVE